jgi:hypothetical protein
MKYNEKYFHWKSYVPEIKNDENQCGFISISILKCQMDFSNMP